MYKIDLKLKKIFMKTPIETSFIPLKTIIIKSIMIIQHQVLEIYKKIIIMNPSQSISLEKMNNMVKKIKSSFNHLFTIIQPKIHLILQIMRINTLLLCNKLIIRHLWRSLIQIKLIVIFLKNLFTVNHKFPLQLKKHYRL